MCKNFRLHTVEEPKPKPAVTPKKSKSRSRFSDDIGITPSRSTELSGTSSSQFSKVSTSSLTSHASLRDSVLPDNPVLYRFHEIAESTHQFSTGRVGKSSVWKSNLRGKTAAITMRKVKNMMDFRSGVRRICSAHHANIISLLGGCCEGENMYLVYDYVNGSTLEDCLRNTRVPGYTVLNTWISRMQIAMDVAQALEYMHHDTDIDYVHNYLKSSSIIITEPGCRARICHVGASYLAGEYDLHDPHRDLGSPKDKAIMSGEITEEEEGSLQGLKFSRKFRSVKIKGTHGYMAPEYVSTGVLSQKNDVYAFGVILLELLTGHKPVRYVSRPDGQLQRVSLVESVNTIFADDERGDCAGRLRTWMDPKLKDSFPVDCAERVARLAVSCVDSEPGKRPDLRYVGGKLSKIFICSQQWHDKMNADKKFLTSTFEAR